MSGLGFSKGTNDYFSKLMRGEVEEEEEEEEGANILDSDDEAEGEVDGGEGEQKRGGMMFVKSTKVLDESGENRNNTGLIASSLYFQSASFASPLTTF